MADSDVSFGVLGPLTVARAGQPITIGGRKEQLVLAHLLARANAVVSVDALIEGVWNGSPPRSAERTLQAYVARLRRAIEPQRGSGATPSVLVTAGAGYRLEVTTGQLDTSRFEQLAQQGAEQLHRGDERASRTLREALDLWRGDPYAEFEDVEQCSSEARRLAELHLVALEDRLDADLVAGGASELVPELESLVAAHPFRERFWGQLMLALYRSGRQADALAAYRRARAILIEELGLEPGPELRRLEAAILAQDPQLDGARAATAGPLDVLPTPLAAVGPAFVGRTVELDWLRSAWAEAVEGRGGFVSVLGPEGIGKTRLVAALAHEVQADGAIVLYGRCDHAHRGPRALLDQTLRSGGSSLSELGGEVALTDLAGAVARFLPTWAARRPVLLGLDDLHLADSDTLEVVADLASWSGAQAMLVVAAFRTDAPGTPGSESGAGETTAQVTLGGLDGDAVAELCAVYDAEGWTPTELARLHDVTGGVPLQVHEQASEWARRRAVGRVEDAADRSTAARLRLAVSRGEIADRVEAIQRLLEERRANLAAREAEVAAPGADVCPYKGLAAFEAVDVANFFGRERLVAELVARLAGARLLAVIGPSGSGKSSVVRAGLLPALDAGVIPVSDGWCSAVLTPGADPARALFRALAADRSTAGRRAVFIDQFEEAFTLCTDDAAQTQFVDQVVELAAQDDTVVIIAVRADHVGHCASHLALAELISGNQVLVGPMRDAELRRAVELPARRAGLTIEPGLVDVIVSDVAGRPGALPLLSTALAETWERRTDRTLNLAGYQSAGGVNGALARMAEDAFLALDDDAQAAARRVMLRLSDAGDDGAVDLRRRLPLTEVAGGDGAAGVAIEAFVSRRLLTVDGDSVEVAHEALLREWPRLEAWLDEDVQGRRLHRRLGDAARAWRTAGTDPSELYRGTRLDAALDWAGTHPDDLNEAEQAFLEASRQQAEFEMADARRRAEEKARANRRLRALLGGVATLLVLALVSGLLFIRQRNRAEQASRETRARELAGESALALEEDPELAILLALEAAGTTEDPLPEAIAAVQTANQTSRAELRADDGHVNVAYTPDGGMLVTDSTLERPAVIVRDATTGVALHRLVGPADVSDLDVSPDGRLVAVSYFHGAGDGAVAAIILWDIGSGGEIARLSGPAGDYISPAFSPDGRLVAARNATADQPGRVIVWDVSSGEERVSFEVPSDVAGSVQFADGSTLLVAERKQERVGIYALGDGGEVGALATPGFEPEVVAVDPAGSRVALAEQFVGIQLWDLSTRQLLRTIPVDDGFKVAWSPDGGHVATSGGNRSIVRILDAETGAEVMALRGHQSGSGAVSYSPDGQRLASVEGGGGLRVWDVTPDGSPELGGVTLPIRQGGRLYVSPDGSEVMVARQDEGVHFVETATGVARSLDGQINSPPSFRPTPSPDWHWLGSVESDGQPRISAVDTLEKVTEPPPCTSPIAFSPDRSLIVLDGWAPCGFESLSPSFEAPPEAVLRSRVVEAGSGREVIDLGERVVELGSAVFDAAGRHLGVILAGPDDQAPGIIELYDVTAGELVERFDLPDFVPFHVAFDPQGRWLAAATADGWLWVFDVAQLAAGTSAEDSVIMRRITHQTGVRPPPINDDGIVATAGNGDGLIRLWDIATGDMILELRYATQGTASLAFDPASGDLLYAVDDVLHRYPLDNEELIALARDRLTRDFTPEECARYLDADRCS